MKIFIWNIEEDVGGSSFHSTFVVLEETEDKAKILIRKKIQKDIIPNLADKSEGRILLKEVSNAKLKAIELDKPSIFYSEG